MATWQGRFKRRESGAGETKRLSNVGFDSTINSWCFGAQMKSSSGVNTNGAFVQEIDTFLTGGSYQKFGHRGLLSIQRIAEHTQDGGEPYLLITHYSINGDVIFTERVNGDAMGEIQRVFFRHDLQEDPNSGTTPQYWDCECEDNYIHPSTQALCETCGVFGDEQPDSRVDEVIARGFELAVS